VAVRTYEVRIDGGDVTCDLGLDGQVPRATSSSLAALLHSRPTDGSIPPAVSFMITGAIIRPGALRLVTDPASRCSPRSASRSSLHDWPRVLARAPEEIDAFSWAVAQVLLDRRSDRRGLILPTNASARQAVL
jgi:hypothetical protein